MPCQPMSSERFAAALTARMMIPRMPADSSSVNPAPTSTSQSPLRTSVTRHGLAVLARTVLGTRVQPISGWKWAGFYRRLFPVSVRHAFRHGCELCRPNQCRVCATLLRTGSALARHSDSHESASTPMSKVCGDGVFAQDTPEELRWSGTPAMVVPAGLVTLSFSSAGCVSVPSDELSRTCTARCCLKQHRQVQPAHTKRHTSQDSRSPQIYCGSKLASQQVAFAAPRRRASA